MGQIQAKGLCLKVSNHFWWFMSDNPAFTIELSEHLVQVRLAGKWSLAQDMAYLSQLAESIDQIKAKPWGILVDMRQWQLEEVKEFGYQQKQVANVHIDRRNQLAECWIVNSPNQAQTLIKVNLSIPGWPLPGLQL